MPVYVVSYDLIKPGKDYRPLYAELEKLSGQRVLLSQWAVNAKGPATALRDYLKPHIDTNDRLLVMARDDGDWASYNALIDLAKF